MISALKFTLIEASLSAIVSVALGAWLAHIWMRREFRAQAALEKLLLLPFFLPPLFVALAVLRVFGQAGLGLDIYGLWGILIAHWILNIPLAFYMVLQEWRRVPLESVLVAKNLGNVPYLIEREVLRRALPPAFGLIFLYASLSFTIVLTLGGGPSATTLELGIYQAIRYQFDLERAFWLSSAQAALGVCVFLLVRRHIEPPIANAHALIRVDEERTRGRALDMVFVAAICVFLFLPNLLVAISGILGIGKLVEVWSFSGAINAFLVSFLTALIAAILTNILAFYGAWRRFELLGWLIAAISPLALATAVILILRIMVNPFSLGVPLVVFIQALVLSPLFLRLWRAALDALAPEEVKLLESLTDSRALQWRLFYWPRLRPQAWRLFFLALGLTLGDLALYPLLAPPDFANLPMVIWQMIGAYRFDAAMALSTILVAIVGALIAVGEWLGKHLEVEIHA